MDSRRYELMHKDIAVALIEFDDEGKLTGAPEVFNEEHLPPRARRSRPDFSRWWADRAIPNTRKELNLFLSVNNIASTGDYLIDNLGLSLSDTYWIRPENSSLMWKDVNLYENSFAGKMSVSRHSGEFERISFSVTYSPDASTGGELPKWWVIENGIRYLVKGNEGGTSQQSRNEVFASEIHKAQGWSNYASYTLVRLPDGRTGCRCSAFTSPEKEFISAWELVGRKDFAKDEPFRENFINACISGGLTRDEVVKQLDYMSLSDFLIANTDRHLNNFGILRNPDTLEFISMAPLFDSGNSMCYRNLENISFSCSVNERTSGFYMSFRGWLEHVSDFSVLDVDMLPDDDIFMDIYPDKAFPQSVPRWLLSVYHRHIEFIRQMQSGKSFYDVQKILC